MEKQTVARVVYSVEEFCTATNTSRSTFYREVNAGRLKPLKRGRRTMITAEEAARWLASLPAMNGEKQAA
ncbi:helix-turn-helix domain-containing protein [Nitrospirillum viridazoti]|uniref:Excisionase family DNA binding protein n=1 Tax=Nitrospirillum amazonense TaxID=28077 RepID=A0A560IT38_9PROT|nr:helix-turn-helix domain-containing protein [Nitrospirillum amazonense]TWB62233.1 excisionase family DNA binding protein [Nitrospirillum amazonense]